MADTPGDARSRAGEFIDDPALLGEPLPVRDASGTVVSWFVPIVAGDRLAGFVELLPDLTHRRTSRFAAAPAVALWLDAGSVRDRAAATLEPGETAGEPYLSFDGTLDRLAWRVPVRGQRGDRLVFVAGDAVWPGPATRSPADGTGGRAR